MKILFIINPVSGAGKRKDDEQFIKNFFTESQYEVSVVYTSGAGSAFTIATQAKTMNYRIMVAAGGDGTVNEVAQAICGTDISLGIIPLGSGNGLARHHKIPMNIIKALENIKSNHTIWHDVIKINEYLSFNVSGIGFDAHVASLFGKDGTRGLYGYLKLVLTEFSNYKDQNFRIRSSNSEMESKAMLLAIANSTQFGNEAVIAPSAITNDGIVNITMVRKMNFWRLPSFALMVFAKQISNSKFATFLSGHEFTITSDSLLPLHIDGEPKEMTKEFRISVVKHAFKLIVSGSNNFKSNK